MLQAYHLRLDAYLGWPHPTGQLKKKKKKDQPRVQMTSPALDVPQLFSDMDSEHVQYFLL